MICGESAGIAASRAIEEATAVQNIDMAAFREALEAAGQKLCWDPERDRAMPAGQSQLTYARLLRECDKNDDGLVRQAEWNAGKAGWEWLFPFIDANQDGKIDEVEYKAFQQYKVDNPHWQKTLRQKANVR